MADPSELRAVAGVTPQIYDEAAPVDLRAADDASRRTINVNTLLPEQAPLIGDAAPDTLSVERGARSCCCAARRRAMATRAPFLGAASRCAGSRRGDRRRPR